MQKSIERKFSSMITKRNSESYSLSRSRFFFFSLLFIGILLGVIVFFAVGLNSTQQLDPTPIKEHIESIISLDEKLSGLFIDVIRLSKIDLCHLFFILISGFTYFCFIASGAIVFAKGFMFGYSLMFLTFSCKNTDFKSIYLFGSIFFWSRLLISMIASELSSETYVFSYDFRMIKQSCSILRRASVTYKFTFVFIKALGGCLLINIIYCLLIKLL